MREPRTVQSSIFDSYSKHDHGVLLEALSDRLDLHPDILKLLQVDLIDPSVKPVGCRGLSVDSVFRCLLLKQMLGISYDQLSFHLSDSITYRTFARLSAQQAPSRAGLQSVIRKIRAETLQAVHEKLCMQWHEQQLFQHDYIRIDSTVVESHIAPPSDSRLLNDSVRVLSRYLATCHRYTGHKVRFTDQRKKSKRLAFAIFYAKAAEKDALYPQLLSCAGVIAYSGECEHLFRPNVNTYLPNVLASRSFTASVHLQSTARALYALSLLPQVSANAHCA